MGKQTVYVRNGKLYRKLNRDEVIAEGAMQSWECGELSPITNSDGETIGDTPSSFSPERDFYNPLLCDCGRHLPVGYEKRIDHTVCCFCGTTSGDED